MDTRGLSYRYMSSPAASMDMSQRSLNNSHHFYPPPKHKNNAYFAENIALQQSKTANVSQNKEEELMDLSDIRYEERLYNDSSINTQSMLNNVMDCTPRSRAMSTPTTNTYVYHANAPRLVDIDNDPFGLAFGMCKCDADIVFELKFFIIIYHR